MLGDECLELSDQLVVAPECEVGVDPELDCCQPDLLEPGDGCLGEALVGEVRERRAPPQRQRVAEPLRRVGRQAAREQAPPLVHQPLEAVEIELVGLDPDDVAGRSGRQHVLRKRLAQPRDVDAQRGGGVLGRVLAPELVDQPVSGNDLVGVEEEPGEKRTRLGPTQGNLASPVPHLERSQDPELHLASLPARDANSCCASETDLKHRRRIVRSQEFVRYTEKERVTMWRFANMNDIDKVASAATAVMVAAAPSRCSYLRLRPQRHRDPIHLANRGSVHVAPTTGDGSSFSEAGVRFSFRVPHSTGWEWFKSIPTKTSPGGPISLNKSIVGPQSAEAIIYWTSFPRRRLRRSVCPSAGPVDWPHPQPSSRLQ